MNPVHYAAVMFEGRWKLISKGLRWGDFSTLEEALAAARRMARESRGLGIEVHLHVHEDTGMLHRHLDNDDGADTPAAPDPR